MPDVLISFLFCSDGDLVWFICAPDTPFRLPICKKYEIVKLTLCLLGDFHAFLSSAIFFFKINYFEKFFKEYHHSANSLDPDQARRFVGPDLGSNCLQKLSADDTR